MMAQTEHREYDDSYPTCAETYSTLRIFSDDLPPEEVAATLGIQATESFRKGDVHSRGKLLRKDNGWFYSTKQFSDSRDFRRHLDKILDALDGRIGAVKTLQSKGCKIEITTYWASSSGQGGPWLMPDQMLKLGTLGISIWWDIYFLGEAEQPDSTESKENL
jgi:hypothetical protein